MTAAWMLYSLMVGGLVAMAASAGQHTCRMFRFPVRWVWIAGMSATVLLSVSGVVRVRLTDGRDAVPVPVTAVEVDGRAIAETDPGASALIRAMVGAVRRVGAGAAQRMYDAVGVGGGRVLSIAWAASSAALLVMLGLTVLRLRYARRHWRRYHVGDVAVLVSADAGPALVGLRHPAIVVPRWLLDQPQERQRLVVQHEEEHRRAGDHVMLATACMLVCLMPWNIALWWMLRRTRLAVELDCDARVLRRGVRPRAYGEVLLEIAGRRSALPFGAPALADSRTHLERRLMAMTGKHRNSHYRPGVAGGLAAVALLGAACAAELPTAAAIDDMDVTTAQLEAERSGLLAPLMSDESPLYMVDGVITAPDAARSIEPGEIQSIEVIKGQAALVAYGDTGSHGVILITTKASVRGARAAGDADRAASGDAVSGRKSGDQVVVRSGKLRLEADGRANQPLIIVDGVIADGSFTVNSLAPESIESIEVLKGEAARRLYDNPRAAHGVIRITTKAGGR